jgi:hypothetical protein
MLMVDQLRPLSVLVSLIHKPTSHPPVFGSVDLRCGMIVVNTVRSLARTACECAVLLLPLLDLTSGRARTGWRKDDPLTYPVEFLRRMLGIDFTFEHAVMIDERSDVRPVLSAHEQRV